MSFLNRMFGTTFVGRKGSRGNRRLPSRKPDRRLTMEPMESRVMMSASPIGNAATHNLDQFTAPALFAGTNQPGTGLTTVSSGLANLDSPAPVKIASNVGTAPLAATKLAAMPYSASQINLSWNSVSGATGYIVDELVSGGSKQLTNAAFSTSFSVTGLSANTTYSFEVIAYQNTASGALSNLGSWSNQASATTGIVVDHPTAATAYTGVSGKLFGPTGQPSYLDVQQGAADDCWLMAGLAEAAVRDPQDIVNMFTADGSTVENGITVSLYKVRLFDNGVPKTVIVDTELPVATVANSSKGATGNYAQTPNGVLWVALAEKAYAQANGAGFVTTSDLGQDSYAALNDGQAAWGLQAITGDSLNDFDTNNTNIAAAWSAGEFVILCTGSTTASPEIVPGHDYALVNCVSSANNQAANAQALPTSSLPYTPTSSMPFLVYNPWGTKPSGIANLVTTSGQSVYGLFTANANFVSANFPQIATIVVVTVGGDAPAETRTHLGVETAADLVLAGWGV